MINEEKTVEKTGYFYDREEQAVVDFNKCRKTISGATINILKLELGCDDNELANFCSGKTLFEIIELSKNLPVENKETAARISKLNKMIDKATFEREQIFNTILRPAFTKMIESIIRRYKLTVPDEEFQQTFHDTMSYLFTKIDNFKPDNNKKAYSYCGTVCKNYLLYKNTQFKKDQFRNIQYDEILSDINDSIVYSERPDEFKMIAHKLIPGISDKIKKMIEAPEKNNLNENELKVGAALVNLLDNWEDVLKYDDESNKLQKSIVLYFLREETMMTTKEVRDNMKKYKAAYKLLKQAALE